jgi:hypothetical protein
MIKFLEAGVCMQAHKFSLHINGALPVLGTQFFSFEIQACK